MGEYVQMSFGKRHLALVHTLTCGVCGETPVQAHHILEGRTPGRKSRDELAIPLCEGCHTGRNGIHGDRAMWNVMKVSELDVLADTLKSLYGNE